MKWHYAYFQVPFLISQYQQLATVAHNSLQIEYTNHEHLQMTISATETPTHKEKKQTRMWPQIYMDKLLVSKQAKISCG